MLIISMSINNHNGGQYMKTIMQNEQAQAGVGTLIIFIAMVLVAAVAAAVLIQTSGVMQSKSTTTTKEAAAAIGENILIEAVEGNYSGTTLSVINITIRVAAGGSDVDLSKLLVKVKADSYNYSKSNFAAPSFRVYALREKDATSTDLKTGGGTGYSDLDAPTLKAGAIARIDLVSPSGLLAKQAFSIALTPEKGTTINMPLTLPAFSNPPLAIYR
jgi:flagellin FlaB